MRKPQIALLDLGGVVFQSTGKSNEKIRWNIISELNAIYGPALNVGEDKFPDFMDEYNTRTGQELNGAEFLEAVFDTLEINTELIDYLRQSYEIIIVSDNYRENIEYISKRYAFASWSIGQIYSFDYQMMKSNPRFFQRLLEELKAYDRDDFVFIDDSPEKIASALRHGIKGILFQNNSQLKRVFPD